MVLNKKADEIIADALGVSVQDVQDYMNATNLTWHEVGDCHTIRAVPSEINQVFGHTGGIGVQKDKEVLISNIQETVDHSSIVLYRSSRKLRLIDRGALKRAIKQGYMKNKITKKKMFGSKKMNQNECECRIKEKLD